MQGNVLIVGNVCVEVRHAARCRHDVLHCVGIQHRVYCRVVRSFQFVRGTCVRSYLSVLETCAVGFQPRNDAGAKRLSEVSQHETLLEYIGVGRS